MHRPSSPGADAMLGQELPALDRGFVQPIDYMGNDLEIVQAARVSYGSSTRKLHDDRGLLRYLMRNSHTSPFEMCEVKFRCKMPIFVARQWIRHRTANVNEMSLRYSEAPDEFYTPALEHISMQASDNKQGRGVTLPPDVREEVARLMLVAGEEAADLYERLAGPLGVARELARAVLPVSLYTQWIWKIDLHNLFHFLQLRLDAHAQLEIRVFAERMAEFVRAWVPLAWEAFTDYRLEAVSLSRMDLQALAMAIDPAAAEHARAVAAGSMGRTEAGDFERKLGALLRLRERSIFL